MSDGTSFTTGIVDGPATSLSIGVIRGIGLWIRFGVVSITAVVVAVVAVAVVDNARVSVISSKSIDLQKAKSLFLIDNLLLFILKKKVFLINNKTYPSPNFSQSKGSPVFLQASYFSTRRGSRRFLGYFVASTG